MFHEDRDGEIHEERQLVSQHNSVNDALVGAIMKRLWGSSVGQRVSAGPYLTGLYEVVAY